MELSEENTLISALQGEGAAHGPDGSTWDSILGGIGDAADIGGAVLGGVTGLSDLGGVSGIKDLFGG
jgi:hypothetical protein